MPKRILLADDSITIQKVVELTFSDGDYEVTAVNNGAKAIQKLAEMRADIILSDIIMPEKNGYEVCEYVKSHPDFRNIPVILLTGTFEPFDPDRADKAGCDAVVTKPFESQSLIQKVEELIAQSKSAEPAAPAPSMPQPPQSFSTGAFPASQPPAANAGFQPHGSEIFSAPAAPAPSSSPMQFAPPPAAAPPSGGETRAFAPVNLGEMAQAPAAPMSAPPPPAMESSPWDEPAEEKSPAATGSGFGSMPSGSPTASEPSPWDEPVSGGETRAFGKMSFDDLQKMAGETTSPAPSTPPPPSVPEPSPWDAPDAGGGETRAIPRMSFDDMQKLAQGSTPAAAAPQETSPWDQPSSADAGSTRAFPPLSLGGAAAAASEQATSSPSESSGSMWDAPEQNASSSDPIPFGGGQSPDAVPTSEPSLWDAPQGDFSGETTALPKMSFDELSSMASPEPPREPEQVPWADQAPPSPPWPASTSSSSGDSSSQSASGSVASDASFAETGAGAPSPQAASTSNWMPDESDASSSASPTTAAAAGKESIGNLTDEQVDRIARRVVELMSEATVRNIAWEVIPDLAERVVKERIRQLESE